MKMEVSVGTTDLESVLLEVSEVPSGEEGDGHAGFRQLGPIVHAEGSGSDHRSGGERGKRKARSYRHLLKLTDRLGIYRSLPRGENGGGRGP